MPGTSPFDAFWDTIDAERARVREDNWRRQQQEGQILSVLAKADNPEIAARAWAGLLDNANPKSKRKGIAAFLGETEANPALPALRQFLQGSDTVTETRPGMPQGASAASMLPIPRERTDAPEFGPAGEGMGEFAQAEPVRFAQPPPPPMETTTRQVPRQVFMLPEEREVEGAVRGWMQTGLTREEALQQVQWERGKSRGGRGGFGTLHEGNVHETEPGSGIWVQDLYDAFGNITRQIPASAPREASTRYSTSMNDTSLRLFGVPYGKLTDPAKAQQVYETWRRENPEALYEQALGRGRGQNVTAANKPISVADSIASGLPIGAPASAYAGQVGTTPTQRDAANVAEMIQPVISNPEWEATGSEPGIVELAQAILPSQEEATLAGFNTAGLLLAYRRTRAEYASKFAMLDSKVAWIQGQVRRLQAQAGAETEPDARRALASIANIQGGLLAGDSREAQLSRIRTLIDAVHRMRDVVRKKQSLTQGTGAPVATPPPGPAGSAAPPAPTRPAPAASLGPATPEPQSGLGPAPSGMPAVGTQGTDRGRRVIIAGYDQAGQVHYRYLDGAPPPAPPR